MKIIIFSLLLVASGCSGNFAKNDASVTVCLRNALKGASDLPLQIGKLLCSYRSARERAASFKNIFEETKTVVENVGCTLPLGHFGNLNIKSFTRNQFFNLTHLLTALNNIKKCMKKVGGDIADLTEELMESLITTCFDAIPLVDHATQILCIVQEGVSDCLSDFLKDTTRATSDILNVEKLQEKAFSSVTDVLGNLVQIVPCALRIDINTKVKRLLNSLTKDEEGLLAKLLQINILTQFKIDGLISNLKIDHLLSSLVENILNVVSKLLGGVLGILGDLGGLNVLGGLGGLGGLDGLFRGR